MLWHTMVPEVRSVAILLRHAERPEIPEGSPGMEIGLTEAGTAAARRIGAALGERIRTITTSPVARCRTTAMLMCEGADRQLEISDQPLLGAPGAFVADGDVAWENWRRMGNEGVIAHLMGSSEALPGMHPPELAARRLLGLLAAALDREAGLHLFVTHDAVLAPLVARTLGHPLEREQWPGFLDAMMLWREDGELVARYREDPPWVVVAERDTHAPR
jgi:broad specificity phosphatase PhoE